QFEYEPVYNNLIKKIDPMGVVTLYDYDSNGNLIKMTQAAGTDAERVLTYTYDEYGQLLSFSIEGDSNTEKATVTLSYDDNGNLASVTDPEGNTMRLLEHDSLGNVLRMRDPRGNEWTYEYDSLGRIISETNPLGNKTSFEYDGANNLTAIINAHLKRFEFYYDDHNNRLSIVGPDGNALTTAYRPDGKFTKITDQSGKSATFTYDNDGRLTEVCDGVGNKIRYAYDESQASSAKFGNPVCIDYPTYSTRLYYDSMQRIVQETSVLENNQAATVKYEYNAAGKVIAVTDEDGRRTTFTYDALNRLSAITNPKGETIHIVHDDRDNVIELIDPSGAVTRYEYDRNDNLVKEILPGGQTTVFTYDEASNLTSITKNSGERILLTYDAANRLIKREYFKAGDYENPVRTVTFTYDELNLLTGYDDGITSAEYTYDDYMRKTSETVHYPNNMTLTYTYTYYENGLKKSFTGPDGVTYEYIYDDANRLTAISIPNEGYITNNAYYWKKPTRRTLPGGSSLAFSYDPILRITEISAEDPASNELLKLNYEYSLGGRILSISSDTARKDYAYDEWNQLIKVTVNDTVAESFSYDERGNRISSAQYDNWQYGPNNELSSFGNTSLEYDQNGRLIRKTVGTSVTRFFYNPEGELIRVEDGEGNVIARYYYDPFGRRLWKDVQNTRTYYFYSNEGLVGEFDENGNLIRSYGYEPDSAWSTDPVFMKVGNTYYWYINDHLGTPIKLIDSTGKVVWAAEYDSFGSAAVQTSQVTNNLRYAGQYYDSETGLHYNWFRYYDPSTGRYITLDPLRYGLNLYSYALNNPIKVSDPIGLCAIKRAFRGTIDALRIWTRLADDNEMIEISKRGDIVYAEKAFGMLKNASLWTLRKLADLTRYYCPEMALVADLIVAIAETGVAVIEAYCHGGFEAAAMEVVKAVAGEEAVECWEEAKKGFANNGVSGASWNLICHSSGKIADGFFEDRLKRFGYFGEVAGKFIDNRVSNFFEYLKNHDPSAPAKPTPKKKTYIMPLRFNYGVVFCK
ncbi:MAG TPA: RHS repeat protein, partial [Deltaproteobacteria bacterium]|nr:RHS repeat protein [Deltaproteobacteria bacterium]